MRRLRFSFLLVLPLVLTGCPRRETRATEASASARAAAVLPAGTQGDLAIDDTKAFLDGVRSQFRDPAAGVPIPANVSEVLERWSALPEQVRRHIPENTPLRIVWFRVGNVVRSVAAVRVRRESNVEHPLGVEIALFAGAPDGAKWVAGRPSSGTPVVALKGDILLVGDDAASLGAAIAWLTRTSMPEAVGHGLRLRIPGDALGSSIRAALDANLEESSESAVASARAEGARHAEAPTLGDPQHFIAWVRDRARRALAYLPDARGATIVVDAGASGVNVEASVDVVAGSPLARMLAGLHVGPPFGFAALPASTALAVSTRRDPGESSWSEILAPIAGPRMSEEDRATLEAASTEAATMREDASLIAVGSHADGPFLLAALSPSVRALDPELVRRVIGIPYLASALGTVVGCGEVRPGPLTAGRAPLCRAGEAPFPEVVVQRGEGANVVMLAVRNEAGAPTHHAGDALVVDPQRDVSTGMFHDPDAQRALAALGDRTVVAAAISARGIIPSLGLLGVPEVRRLASSRTLPTSAAPIVLGVSRDANGALVGRVIAPPHALEEIWAIAYLLATLAGG